VEGLIGRSGVQKYRRADGTTVRAFRPADEVRAADFSGSPLTVGHPPGGVRPENYRQVAVGVARERTGEEVIDGQVFPRQDLQVSAAEAIDSIRDGRLCELSCGYDVVQDWTPGVADGEEYDVIFRELKPNHIALGGPGFARAGRSARVLLHDSEENLMSDNLYRVADSVDPPTSADRDKLLVDNARLQAENARLISDAAAAVAALEETQGKLAAAENAVAAIPAKVADGVREAVALRQAAQSVLGADFAFDGKSEAEIKSAVRVAKIVKLRELDPQVQVSDSTSDLWLDAYLEAAAKFAVSKPHDYSTQTPAVTDSAEPVSIQDFISKASQEAYKAGR
jgi:hypothetical protein